MSAADPKSRLDQVKDTLTSTTKSDNPPQPPWDPESDSFPARSSLSSLSLPNAPPEAAWVWGPSDELGRLNLLTPRRIKAAASAEIRTGDLVPLNLPLTIPATPGFGREQFVHRIKPLWPGIAYDDLYECNSQSGSQWDGFRHFAHVPSKLFFNGVTEGDIMGDKANTKGGVQAWADHGFAGRGVLIDYWGYVNEKGNEEKRYDPFDSHGISFEELVTCGKAQGLDIRPASQGGNIHIGDVLLVRTGFVDTYHGASDEKRRQAALRGHRHDAPKDETQRWAGLAQSQDTLTWLHDSYFAAVGGDAPAFERWPSAESYHLHEYILALWGLPLGEMLDLERLSKQCRAQKRWTFFFNAAPVNCPGGVASWTNATAIF